jgi:amino acid adenylation domain-containing protein
MESITALDIHDFLSELQHLDVHLFLQDGQLRCNAPKGVLTPALQQQLKARKAELVALLQSVQPPIAAPLPAIEPMQRQQRLPLSFTQQRLWFLDQLSSQSTTYNISSVYRLVGAVDGAALEQSFRCLLQRHESLCTQFAAEQGQPYQVIVPAIEFHLERLDLRTHPQPDRDALAQQYVEQAIQQEFDLSQAPLWAARLLQLDQQEFILVVTWHHIIADGWSVGIFFREFNACYQALTQTQPLALRPLPVQYPDFVLWQRQWLQGERWQAQLDYWKHHLQGAPPVLELPGDRPRPPQQTYRGSTYRFTLVPELVQAVQALSQREGATLFMTLLAAFNLLLYRYSGQTDIVVGSPIANRSQSQMEDLIGFFANTLALRTQVSGEQSFRELLSQVRGTALEAYTHQDLPFDSLVEALNPSRSLSYSPIFQVMFVLQNTPGIDLALPAVQVEPYTTANQASKFDLTLSLEPVGESLAGHFEYSTELFDQDTIARLAGHFQVLLHGIVANPDRPVAQLPLLTDAERQQLLVEWNQTQRHWPHAGCFHQVFAQRAAAQPEATAVVYQDQALTYGELNARANQLAHYLQTLGVGPEVMVGLSVEPSVELVVGLLAIFKAGGAYVPIDPAYPPQRQAYMLADSQVRILLTQQPLLPQLPDHSTQVICLDADWPTIAPYPDTNPSSGVSLDSLAYVIYTSGSTGQPKGVLVTHRGIPNLAATEAERFRIDAASRVLQFTSFSFDACLSETVMTLYPGAALYVASREERLPGPRLIQLLQSQNITHATLPPSALAVLPQEPLPDLKVIIVAGEPCPAGLVAEWGQNRRFCNAYGPTETTVCATTHVCEPDGRQPPIGRPIANTQIYILDAQQQPLPIGVAGEVYIGGIGLARGYHNRPDLTAAKFVPHPFSPAPQARLYRTGDLARYRSDGTVEFLGRIDHQVKLRGFRIEPGEISAVLEQHGSVAHALVLLREDEPGNKRLVAYVVAAPGTSPTAAELRAWVLQHLPDYMVPSVFILLERFPLTPNGKVDRAALPSPDPELVSRSRPCVPPRTPIEQSIGQIWADVLKLQQVSIYDNFFELGGHSLLATQVISRLRDELQVEVALRHLFEADTLETLAEYYATVLSVQQLVENFPNTADEDDDDYESGAL